MAGYKTIKDQIVAVLGTVSSVKVVYGREMKMLNDGGFPAACVEAKEHAANFNSVGTGGTNRVVYQHYIRVYFRTNEQNDADYEDVLESVADDVLAALAHNVTLNGACLYALPVSGVWRDGEKESPVRYIEIVEEATMLPVR